MRWLVAFNLIATLAVGYIAFMNLGHTAIVEQVLFAILSQGGQAG